MKVQIFLEEGDKAEEVPELMTKAFHHKHEKTHTEEFQDPLIEELLDELDKIMKKTVLLGGFEETVMHLVRNMPYAG